MRFELIGFRTIEFEDGTLTVGEPGRVPTSEDRPLPMPVLLRLCRLCASWPILGYGVCSRIKSQPCVNGS
jgi:hypothetical protein